MAQALPITDVLIAVGFSQGTEDFASALQWLTSQDIAYSVELATLGANVTGWPGCGTLPCACVERLVRAAKVSNHIAAALLCVFMFTSARPLHRRSEKANYWSPRRRVQELRRHAAPASPAASTFL